MSRAFVHVVPEPSDNAYGRYRVLQRTDGRFVVHDREQWPPAGPVFRDERSARAEAARRAGGGA